MKKLNTILLSLIFTAGTLNASFLPTPNPYVIGPEGRSVEDLRDFARPNQMFSVLPNRPIVATDASGARQYYTPSGKLAVSVATNGETTFSLQGTSITKDAEGKVTSISKNIVGTNLIETKNEFGEVIGYKETGLGGKVLKEYDKDTNLTKTYNYDQFGKNISSIVNEMTQAKTVFDDRGLAAYELDYEGNRLTKYEYDDKNRLTLKTDMYGNRTHYDTSNGTMVYTENKDGIVLSRYNYVYDSIGNYTLDNVVDPTTKEITYFKNGKQTVTKNHAGAVVTDYFWNGSKLVATFNRENQETTWYDIDGRTLYTSFNDKVISKNLYHKGQLVGIWDAKNNQVTILKNERRELILQLGDFGEVADGEDGFEFNKDVVKEPTGEDIKAWIDAGLIDSKYLINPL